MIGRSLKINTLLEKANMELGSLASYAELIPNERWEFKSITGNAVRTMSEAIGEAARQAQRVMIEIASSVQLKQLEKAIISRVPLIEQEGRMISILCVSLGKKMAIITWKELQDSKSVSDILTSLID